MGINLPSHEDKALVVETMFDRISPSYDRMNRLMTFGMDSGWRRATIEALRLKRDDVVIDLACGTGDLAFDAAAKGARVAGVDFSAGMLHFARQRAAARAESSGVTWIRADALCLPFDDESCDALVSGFALRNFANLEQALQECARVLRDGARIALLEVDTPRFAPLRFGHQVWFNYGVPMLGRLLADRDAYAYLPESVVYLPEGEGLSSLLRSVGFDEVTKRNMAFGAVQMVSATRRRA
jgi:demethylmenaquinone methyltransferase/2-methoxy-6-polyprenyl-1,4-benzoquinol methylase